MSALRISDLRAGYNGSDILSGVSFEVGRGQVVGLLGRNGVGKSTLLRTIMGLVRARSGTIELGGRIVTDWPTHRIAGLQVAYVPQDGALFDELSVRSNLEIVLPRRDRLERRTEQAFESFPVLAERLNQRAGSLSGGERKMLMMARVLLQEPDLILLDEVTEGVQPSVVAQIGVAIEQQRERHAAILLVEQKIDFTLSIASNFFVMKRGEIVERGNVADAVASVIKEHLVL